MPEITEPITTTLFPPEIITTTLSVGQGPAGATGPAGIGTGPIAAGTLAGNNTGIAAIPSGLTAAQARALLGLATTDSITFAGLTLSGNLTASGTITASGGGTTQIVASGIRRRDTQTNFLIFGSGAVATGNFSSITLSPLADGIWTQASGTLSVVSITPSYNQVASTASNTDLFINRTETAVGSGAQLFADFQVNSSSRFSVSNAGNVVTSGNVVASGTIRLGTFTVGTLPSAAANTRARAFVTDSSLAFNSTNLGATVTAGGAILVPVLSNGTNWVIG
jgi:hypothetical protein